GRLRNPFVFSSRRRHTRFSRDWSSDVCSADLEVITKADESPVTAADLAANRHIMQGLQALTPDIPILSEEAADVPYEARRHWTRFWLVDPLDGTREFIAGTDEFTVNIALIEADQ